MGLDPPPPQLAQMPAIATTNARQIIELRRRRGERNPINTIAGTTPIHVANIQGELGWSKAAVAVRAIVSVAVDEVPTAPSVIVGGLNEHVNPGGRPAQESTSVRPAEEAFGVNVTVNVADCPAPRVALCGEVVSEPPLPTPATLSPEPAIASPKTVVLGVPVLKVDKTFPELISMWSTFELQ